jgi:two-component system, NarL family, nitrate/nitrite response regulator NarL
VTRVLVVAETRLFRDGLAQTLSRENVEVVGAAAVGEDALHCVRSLEPDIVVLDMARLESAETLAALAQVLPTVKVVAVGVPEVERHVIACAEAGIAGYVRSEGTMAELIAALAAEREPDVDVRLTPRESEISELLADGLSNKEIAQQLCVEVATVKNHVHSILDKLKVSRRGEAAAHVRRRRARIPAPAE